MQLFMNSERKKKKKWQGKREADPNESDVYIGETIQVNGMTNPHTKKNKTQKNKQHSKYTVLFKRPFFKEKQFCYKRTCRGEQYCTHPRLLVMWNGIQEKKLNGITKRKLLKNRSKVEEINMLATTHYFSFSFFLCPLIFFFHFLIVSFYPHIIMSFSYLVLPGGHEARDPWRRGPLVLSAFTPIVGDGDAAAHWLGDTAKVQRSHGVLWFLGSRLF